MNFYLKLLIKILEKSMTAKDSEILKKFLRYVSDDVVVFMCK